MTQRLQSFEPDGHLLSAKERRPHNFSLLPPEMVASMPRVTGAAGATGAAAGKIKLSAIGRC